MAKRAEALLADPHYGAKLRGIADVDGPAAPSQPALRETSLVDYAKIYLGGSDDLARRVDREALPQVLRALAVEAHKPFIAALEADLGGAEDARLVKTDAKYAVKSSARMAVKVDEYATEAAPDLFGCAQVVDALRATVACDGARAVSDALDRLTASKRFKILRLKNKLGKLKKPYNLHVNAEFAAEGLAPIVVEIHIVADDINTLANKQHLFYELVRAPDAARC